MVRFGLSFRRKNSQEAVDRAPTIANMGDDTARIVQSLFGECNRRSKT